MTHERDPHENSGTGRSRRVLVIIPTYNERENLPLIHRRVKDACPDVHVLVVDDESPDGTGQLADELAAADPGCTYVLHRNVKDGLAAAYLQGFVWGMQRNYSVLVEMDADGSHAPEQLHRLLEAVEAGADLAIGSRYVRGGTVRNWPRRRRVLSKAANTYSRLILGVGVYDITGGYRAYRREVLEALDLDTLESRGYCFQVEMTWRSLNAGFAVVEVPITFTEREVGASKMSGSNIGEGIVQVARWGVKDRLRGLRTARISLTAQRFAAAVWTAIRERRARRPAWRPAASIRSHSVHGHAASSAGSSPPTVARSCPPHTS
ncbi:hypothetical protein YM3MPS_52070 [Mycobacterium pseudoshottsii]|nr:Undecaprenyl-phosphate mannosyltransferase [Mycobacterium marinum]BEH79404.1 hypothetical protein YM3MPS_52070 [Mycobacterium pseudoshottsii]